MIQSGHYNFVTWTQFTTNRACQREGDGRHILPKDDLVLVTMEKIRHRLSRGGNDGVGAAAGGKRPASIRVRLQKIILDGIHHLPRHLCACWPIEKSSLATVHL